MADTEDEDDNKSGKKEKKPSSRDDNLCYDDKLCERMEKVYKRIEKNYEDQADRHTMIKDNWDVYRCKLGPKQLFNGRNQLFVPLVYDAVRARATRYTNQLFPQNGKHIECVTADGQLPRAALAIVEHHIDETGLRDLTQALCVSGDVEGQYSVYASWQDSNRYLTRRTNKEVEEEGLPIGKVEDTEEKEESLSGPVVEIIPDADIAVVPGTASTLNDAIGRNGAVCIIRRWDKDLIEDKIADEEIDEEAGERLLSEMDKQDNGAYLDSDKLAVKSAGIRKDGRGDWAMVYEIWTLLKLEEGKRLCQIFMGARDNVLSIRRNPYWSDKLPILSVPVQRQAGSIKGEPPVSFVSDLQYFANDVYNEAADATNYALLPILKRDPEAATAPLVLSPGAVWDVAPAQVDIVKFPEIWKEAYDIIGTAEQQINKTLATSPAMMTRSPAKAGAKKNQAEVSQEQQVEILTTADAVTVIEFGILTPLASFFLDLDYQFRHAKILARQYGPMGMAVVMEEVPPLQNDTRVSVRWSGVEGARNAQRTQQKITALGVVRALPPAMYPDYTLNAQPLIVDLVEDAFGPQQGRQVLVDNRTAVSVDPGIENELMDEGIYMEVHPMDNDVEHSFAHKASIEKDGDDTGAKMMHLKKHEQQIVVKTMAQKMALNPQGQGGGAPGQGGSTPPGAQPRGPQGPQKPAGTIPQDQMQDPSVMPRKM